MHHVRGTIEDEGNLVLDPANVYVEYLGPQDGSRSNWNGYVLVPEGHPLRTGVLYTLVLRDGRSGNLVVDHFDPDETTPGHLKAIFYSETPLA